MECCPECGFDYDAAPTADVPELIIAGAGPFADLLRGPDGDLRKRRSPTLWSSLEYGCHLRDVLLVQRERVLAARRSERPSIEPMGRDERVTHDGYAEQDPVAVADELVMSARLLANVLTRLRSQDWGRTVMYNYPQKAERTLGWVAAHSLHEVNHHLLDARRQLA